VVLVADLSAEPQPDARRARARAWARGVRLFLRASDTSSWPAAIAAGLIAGLAIQTKYTACLVPAVMLVYALMHGGIRFAMVASAAAVAVAGSWEAFTWFTYGQSQFIDVLHEDTGGLIRKVQLLPALVVVAGGVGSAWLFFSLGVLGWRRSRLIPAMAVCLLCFLVIGWMPSVVPAAVPEPIREILGKASVNLHPATDLFRVLGCAGQRRLCRCGDRCRART
jgi:hypothetical protein